MNNFKLIDTSEAPAAIGPYSQAVVAGEWVFASGQIPLDPSTGEVVEGGVAEQTDRVMNNLAAVLGEAAGSLNHVVKTTVYLADMATFGEMNEVYARHFGDHRPARATVEAGALPKNVAVEIDLIARIPS
ncbi:MAG TPA: reactive intermediate/imine deaminase [Gemmatimonadetes bacterium]|nr:reactive intermediate/imine deaminase [Gemmatimonadota bacterium]MBD49590.1 reactive intermediate/imine deaminase [Gemmatimonadota bacterium]MCH2463224.1 RidA family protein [Gemmatimonadota bacterium]MEC7846966.1 RidA family protein [Gemmatimonadota bacterium]MED5564832.1 RidA family protein [Gemmatimonadota bacterium]